MPGGRVEDNMSFTNWAGHVSYGGMSNPVCTGLDFIG